MGKGVITTLRSKSSTTYSTLDKSPRSSSICPAVDVNRVGRVGNDISLRRLRDRPSTIPAPFVGRVGGYRNQMVVTFWIIYHRPLGLDVLRLTVQLDQVKLIRKGVRWSSGG